MYFDDLKINYQKSKIVHSNNYYAFGLQTKDSWMRMDTKPNQYLYNAGSELNEATSNYEMMFRNYDPAIGRMSGVDPMVNSFASLTPYNYSFNDPVFWNDPSGAIADNSNANSNSEKEEYEDCSCGMYGSNWNLATYGGGFGKYGVATGWSDGYVDMILDAKQGDAQALETYGAMHGVSPIGDVNIMNSLKQAGLLDFNSSGDAGFWSDDTSSPLTIESIFIKFSDHRQQTGGDPRTAIVQESGGKIYILANGLTSTFGLGTGITAEQIRKGIVFATEEGATGVKVLSRSLAYAGVGITLAQIAAKNGPISLSDGARLVNATIYTAVGFVPGIGPVLSFGLTTADALGAFEGYYKAVDSMTGIDPTIAWKTGDPRVMNPILKVSYSLTGN